MKESIIRHEIWDTTEMERKHVAIIKKGSGLDELLRLISGSDILRDIDVQFDHTSGTIIALDEDTKDQ